MIYAMHQKKVRRLGEHLEMIAFPKKEFYSFIFRRWLGS